MHQIHPEIFHFKTCSEKGSLLLEGIFRNKSSKFRDTLKYFTFYKVGPLRYLNDLIRKGTWETENHCFERKTISTPKAPFFLGSKCESSVVFQRPRMAVWDVRCFWHGYNIRWRGRSSGHHTGRSILFWVGLSPYHCIITLDLFTKHDFAKIGVSGMRAWKDDRTISMDKRIPPKILYFCDLIMQSLPTMDFCGNKTLDMTFHEIFIGSWHNS